MNSKLPLQIFILKNSSDRESSFLFEEALDRAFKGGIASSGYVASGEDLGFDIRTFDGQPYPYDDTLSAINSVCHSLIISILGSNSLTDQKLLDWLNSCSRIVRMSKGRHSLLILALDARSKAKVKKLKSKFVEVVLAKNLGEFAIQPAMFSLMALHSARTVIDKAIETSKRPGFLKLFISHAKLDGLPLAKSLKHQIDEIPWLKSFYDARDLKGKRNWELVLKNEASSSLLIVLRTDAYERRPWCKQEALWAERAAAPSVLVEARPGLIYPAGELPLERMPSVRIPDGNLIRILNAALRESLRYLLFQRRIIEMLKNGDIPKGAKLEVFSYPPSMSALVCAIQKLNSISSNKPKMIFYPDPPLRTGLYEAAQALIEQADSKIELLTPDTMAIQG